MQRCMFRERYEFKSIWVEVCDDMHIILLASSVRRQDLKLLILIIDPRDLNISSHVIANKKLFLVKSKYCTCWG